MMSVRSAFARIKADGPIARGTIRTSFVLGLRLIVQAGTLLLVARMLGPDQFGAFAGVAALAVVLSTLSTFGTHFVLLAEVSRDPTRRDQILTYALPSTLLCSGVLLVLYLLLCVLALSNAGVTFYVLLAIGISEICVQPLLALSAMEHLGLTRIARSQLLTMLPMTMRLIAASVVFVLHPAEPLVAYAHGYLAASLIALAIAIATMPAQWPGWRSWRLPSKAELRHTAGYAALNITAISPAELDKTLATKLLPLESAGLYAAGARIIGAATLPVIALMLSALPRLFRERNDQPSRTPRLLRWIFGATLTYSVCLAATLWALTPMFVTFFGPRYQGLQHTIHWLTLAVPGIALRIAAGNVLLALAKPWMRVGFEIVGLFVLATASILLTTRFGPIGMPVALGCSEWVMAMVGTILTLVARRQGSEFRSMVA